MPFNVARIILSATECSAEDNLPVDKTRQGRDICEKDKEEEQKKYGATVVFRPPDKVL